MLLNQGLTQLMYSITTIRHLHGYIVNKDVFAINNYCPMIQRSKGTTNFGINKGKTKKLSREG